MKQPPHHPYEEEGYEVLRDAFDQSEADVLLAELQSADIQAIQYPSSVETSLNFPPSQTSGGILILVHRDQMDEARALLDALENRSSGSEKD